tara:strand:+ start:210 stop:389 length:180 start_codon:yes stop_codon:yes gene_type:complete
MSDELYKEYQEAIAEARACGDHDFPRWTEWLLLHNDPDEYNRQQREIDEVRLFYSPFTY